MLTCKLWQTQRACSRGGHWPCLLTCCSFSCRPVAIIGNMDQHSHMAGAIRPAAGFCWPAGLQQRQCAYPPVRHWPCLLLCSLHANMHASCRAVAIHGDMDQHSRMATLADFKAGKQHVLVATDVAARGLDIKSIKSVVNYDAGKDIDTHVHRIGRTGRAGDKEGVAYTLVTPRETRFAGGLASLSMLGWDFAA